MVAPWDAAQSLHRCFSARELLETSTRWTTASLLLHNSQSMNNRIPHAEMISSRLLKKCTRPYIKTIRRGDYNTVRSELQRQGKDTRPYYRSKIKTGDLTGKRRQIFHPGLYTARNNSGFSVIPLLLHYFGLKTSFALLAIRIRTIQ